MNPKIVLMVLIASVMTACSKAPTDYSGPVDDWLYAGNTIDGQRFSPLTQINPDNVTQLKEVWRYSVGEASNGFDGNTATALQVTPLAVNGSLYLCTPYNRVVSLNPSTGEENWAFDPQTDRAGVYNSVCRGVSWHESNNRECPRRVFLASIDARLIAINADTGKPCRGFGRDGEVNLKAGLGDVRQAEYYSTSPPLVVNNLVIPNAFIADGQRVDSPGGGIRAFDVHSGELKWVWDSAPPGRMAVTAADLKSGKTLTRGTPNSWGLLSANKAGDTVFVPTGGPQPDHYGGKERGDADYYGTSIIALDAATGKLKWNFQTVHHDIWDYDVAAQPVVYEQADGTVAVVAATKMGHIFLLDQSTGEPIFPVEERPVPQTRVAGEYTSPTQPFPTKPQPVHPAMLDEEDLFGVFPGDKSHCRQLFESMEHSGIFSPPSMKGTITYPGIGGGINWGSVSINPKLRQMVVNLQINPFSVQLVNREEMSGDGSDDQVGFNPQEGTPYVVARNFFTTPFPNMRPCVKPPWGKLVAIDMDTGDINWEKPLGNLNGLAPLGVGRFFEWGTPNTGGSIQTASGLIFIGATMDKYFRAFDGKTGKTLWQTELPFSAHATPMTYRLGKDQRQFVLIAAGGHAGLLSPPGDTIIAFALDE